MGNAIAKKLRCAEEFAKSLARRLGRRVFKIVLFGSVAKGIADTDSDIDILVVVDSVDDDVKNVVAEAAFEYSVKCSESIEYIVMGLEEYRVDELDNPLIYEVKRWGIVLYEDPAVEMERVEKLVRLAEEYFNYAKRCAELFMYRAAIDLGQNAIELLLKALIILRGEALPRTHGGYIHRFGELYVVSGLVSRGIVAKLYRVLELRNRSRYDPDYIPTEIDVDMVLQTYRELRDIVEKILRKTRG